jgi:hypothetical protein
MVEAIPDGNRIIRTTQEDGTVTSRIIPKFRAGRRFLCTVPNRNARTLVGIIRKYIVPGATIRTDGWRGYSSLHPAEWIDARSGALRIAMADGDQHVYQHQVVNHSEGFATRDQVRQNNTPGLINTNIIEGLWADVKRYMIARHRTKVECPFRLMEYIWHYENRDQVWGGLLRGLAEVSFPGRSTSESVAHRLITEEEGSEDRLEGDPTEEENATHDIDGKFGSSFRSCHRS